MANTQRPNVRKATELRCTQKGQLRCFGAEGGKELSGKGKGKGEGKGAGLDKGWGKTEEKKPRGPGK